MSEAPRSPPASIGDGEPAFTADGTVATASPSPSSRFCVPGAAVHPAAHVPSYSQLSVHNVDLPGLDPRSPRAVVITLEGRVDAPVELVWRLMAHTSRNNRLVGRKQLNISEVLDDPFSKEVSFTDGSLRWREPPASWVAGRRYVTSRNYHVGLLRRSVIEATLTPLTSAATRVRYDVTLFARTYSGRIALACGLAWALLPNFIALLRRLVVESQSGQRDVELRRQRARSAQQARLLDERIELLRVRCSALPLAMRVADLIRGGYDDEVSDIRPFELADSWCVDRRDLVVVCLHAVRVGLLSLSWVLACPNCERATVVRGLDRLPQLAVHCNTCQISVATDTDRAIELRFNAHEDVRDAAMHSLYCPNDPSNLPFALLQEGFSQGGAQEFELHLPNEELVMRDLISQAQVRLLPDGKARDRQFVKVDMRAALVPRDAKNFIPGVSRSADNDVIIHFAPGLTRLVISTTHAALVRLEKSDWNSRGVRPSFVAGLEAFRALGPPEVLEPGQKLTVTSMAFICFEGGDAARALLESQGGQVLGVRTLSVISMSVLLAFPDGLERALGAAMDAQRLGGFRAGIAVGPTTLLTREGHVVHTGRVMSATEDALRYAGPGELITLRATLSHDGARHFFNTHGVDGVDVWVGEGVPVDGGGLSPRELVRLVKC